MTQSAEAQNRTEGNIYFEAIRDDKRLATPTAKPIPIFTPDNRVPTPTPIPTPTPNLTPDWPEPPVAPNCVIRNLNGTALYSYSLKKWICLDDSPAMPGYDCTVTGDFFSVPPIKQGDACMVSYRCCPT